MSDPCCPQVYRYHSRLPHLSMPDLLPPLIHGTCSRLRLQHNPISKVFCHARSSVVSSGSMCCTSTKVSRQSIGCFQATSTQKSRYGCPRSFEDRILPAIGDRPGSTAGDVPISFISPTVRTEDICLRTWRQSFIEYASHNS